MKKISFFAIYLIFSHFAWSQNSSSQPKIEYFLSMEQPQTHYFDVVIKLSNFDAKTKQQGFVDLKMAVWTPGSYLVREYAKNVESVSVTSGTANLKSDKINKNTWRVRLLAAANEATVKYKVYANELTVRTSFLDDSHGYLNPASVFMYVNDWRQVPSTINIKPYKDWNSVSTGLKSLGNNTFEAENLDILIDSPIEIGTQKVLSFDLKGIPHKIAMYGDVKFDETKVTNDFKKVCESALSVVGEHPCKDYTFLIHNVGLGGGGLEHLNSTTCQTSRMTYASEKMYQGFMSLIAHEYFHLWNVKRIRPKALGPFDYENENYTHLLWFSEGCTSFYENYILRRANMMTPDEYLKAYVTEINAIENQPGNKVQSVTESSWDAWIKYYRPNENSKNSTVSYYDKGAVLGGVLNLLILQSTNGSKNLDDVMRLLYQEYYKKQGRGFSDDEFQKAVENVAGKSMNDFFQKYISGTETIPYNTFLEAVGMKLVDKNAENTSPALGVECKVGLKISSVLRDSPAYNDGLNVGDEILQIDGSKPEDLTKLIANKKVGDVVEVKIRRDGLDKKYNVTLQRNPTKSFSIEPIENATKEQKDLYKKWMFL
ncbi:putative metalloprotease with PDZ domain [Arcicella aurantiaca]|uniref:Putative metalloprotease with PDZ domain n=1 Tax=Arcicella aurantiaca TaxID=591202 RepID=A0A316DQI5_9BACT|nr:PDZ domain-containing protein [Arcicella aurantiaca]PWK20235.1 putative metalloprotease with PDZ domain [Arcicella aurantiaca]